MPNYASSGFGSGFAQGFGFTAAESWPKLVAAALSAAEKEAGKQASEKFRDKLFGLLGGAMGGGKPAGLNFGAGPVPPVQGLPELGAGNQIPMTMQSGAVCVQPDMVGAVQQQLWQAGQVGQQPEAGGATMVPSFWMDAKGNFGVKISEKDKRQIDYDNIEVAPGMYSRRATYSDPSRPGWMIQKILPGSPMPAATIQEANKAAQGLGFTGKGIDAGAQALMAAKGLPPAAQQEAVIQAQAMAQQLAQSQEPAGISAEAAVSAAETRKAKSAGAVTGAQAEARAAVEKRTQPGIVADIAKARITGNIAAERGPAKNVVSILKEHLKGIKLPTGGLKERIDAAPRLVNEQLQQSNQSLVRFENVKEGFIATLVRAAGDRGALQNYDIQRMRDALPTVVPGVGRLPDTAETANNKLDDMLKLLGELQARDPGLQGDLEKAGFGGLSSAAGATPSDVGVKLPQGWTMEVKP